MTETELIHVCDVGSDKILWDSVTSLDTESSVGIGIGEGLIWLERGLIWQWSRWS